MKLHFVTLFAIVCLTVSAQHCEAQVPRNVTVQLPTFRVFSTSTTVVVPDRGSLYLGGVNRSRRGQNHFSPAVPRFGNRGRGRNSSAAGLSINATIIDHDEIDRALLAEAARRRGARFDIRGRPVVDAPKLPTDVVGQRWARGRRAR